MRGYVIDDDKLHLEKMVRSFQREGITAYGMSDPTNAYESIKEAQPDFVLLDLYMPEKDGFEICKELKSDPETRDIAVFIVTSSESSQDAVRSFHLGCLDYLHKPVKIDDLVQTVVTHKVIETIKEAWAPARATIDRLADKYKDY